MDAITSQIHSLVKNADEAGRKSIQKALKELLRETQDPKDLMFQLLNSPVELALVRIGIDLKLFEALTDSYSPRTVSSLADQVKADQNLLGRVLRYLASNKLIQETGVDEFTGNQTTQFLADKKIDPVVSNGVHIIAPTLQATPGFLAETDYQDITLKNKTPFQKAFNTELPVFEWLAEHPEHMRNSQLAMVSTQSGAWVRDFESLDNAAEDFIMSRQSSSDAPFFVDVGGSHGHQTVYLRDKHPGLSGRLVLQDMPQVVEQVSELDGIKVMVQDFFTPQAVQGARFYYLSRVLHDWPDDQCVKILQNIVPVMASDSQILVDETVLPNTDVSWQAAMADLYMMFLLAGKERSEKQWAALADNAGLRVASMHVYDSLNHRAVLVLERK